MPPVVLDPAAVMDLVERIAAVAIVLTGMELVLARSELRPGGALDWRLLSVRPPVDRLDRFVRQARFRPLLEEPGIRIVGALDVALAAGLMIWPRFFVIPAAAMAVHIVLARRNHQSVDGSDDMLMVILGASVIRGLSSESVVQAACVLFVAGQSMLSYLTSGVSKAQSVTWWTGTGLRGTLTTRTYSEPHVAIAVARWPVLTRILGPFTIVWESLFSLFVLAGPIPAAFAILIALVFHVICATVMGLAAFLWAFGAALPAVFATSVWFANAVPIEVRLLLVLAAAIPLAAAIAFVSGQARQTGK